MEGKPMKTFLTLMALTLTGLSAYGQADDKRIDQLVEQLGSEDFQTRDAADRERRKIGRPAVPALETALESSDAERADRARKILDAIAKKKEAPKREMATRIWSSIMVHD